MSAIEAVRSVFVEAVATTSEKCAELTEAHRSRSAAGSPASQPQRAAQLVQRQPLDAHDLLA